MRYWMIAVVMLAALPAQAKYAENLRAGFLKGCNQAGEKQPAETQAKLKTACDCGMDKIETNIPEAQFMEMLKLPDQGMSKIKPLLMQCAAK